MMKKEILLAYVAVGSLMLAMANSVFAEIPKVEILMDKIVKACGVRVRTPWPSPTTIYDVRPLAVLLEKDVVYKKNCQVVYAKRGDVTYPSDNELLKEAKDFRICRYKVYRQIPSIANYEITDAIFVNSENNDCETLFKNYMRIDCYGFVEPDPDKLN
jgi:hypothetical protein